MAQSLTRHLPLALLAAAILSMAACHHDEPNGNRPGQGGSHVTPGDTVPPNDTTTHPTDTITPPPTDTTSTDTFTLTLSALRDYGYMGQTLQFTAVTSSETTVTWASSNPLAATVDNQGLVSIANLSGDGKTIITASACGVTDSLSLQCLYWAVAALTDGAWSAAPYRQLHHGDTLSLTLVGSNAAPIDDGGFNAASCQWSVTCRQADAGQLFDSSEAPSQTNGWQARYVISPDAPTGVTFTVMARFGQAASALSCVVMP